MLNLRRGDPFLPLLENPVTAISYESGDEIENLLARVADDLKSRGYRLAGFVQRSVRREGRVDCDMVLEDLATGRRINIAEDRGPGARGCKLDVSALLAAGEGAAAALESGADLLVLNKYGKTEHDGGGLRPLIARAIERGVPLLIAVPIRNWASWREFAGESDHELSPQQLRRIAGV